MGERISLVTTTLFPFRVGFRPFVFGVESSSVHTASLVISAWHQGQDRQVPRF